MTLRHMRIFAEVYRTRNVTHAARNLHMTQPAVTRAIQELEQHYGVRLFERLYRHLSPTEAAQRLYAQAVYLLDTFDHMEAAMRDWDSLGVVRVGATVTLGSTILPVLARRFAALYPGIELQAKVANGSVLADALCENQLDLALLENSVSVPDLHTEPIGTDCLCAVLAPAHPLAQQAAVQVDVVLRRPAVYQPADHAVQRRACAVRAVSACRLPRSFVRLRRFPLHALRIGFVSCFGRKQKEDALFEIRFFLCHLVFLTGRAAQRGRLALS